MGSLMPRVDRATRAFWRVKGRPVDLAGEHSWLAGPMHDGGLVGDRWLRAEAAAHGGTVGYADGAGLLPDMSVLDGPGFQASRLRPEIRDFYEHTADWRMDVRARWSALFRPGGVLVSGLFGRRVQQLALPTRASDLAQGMESSVATIVGPDGGHRSAGWIRRLRSTGEYVYSGCYSARLLPGSRCPSVHVAFPLESGNVQVFLRPSASPDGALRLSSPAGDFGEDGAYVVVRHGDRAHASRIPVHETFHVHTDSEGTLRTDHLLHLWSRPALRLHYRLTRATA